MFFSATTATFFLCAIAACLSQPTQLCPPPEPIRAVAVLSGMSNATGSIEFVQESPDSPTSIFANITGLPEGEHGIHIHEFGDLTGGCPSAGEHYNPWNKTHGAPDSEERHAGDFGNIRADCEGNAILNITSDTVKLSGPYSVIGRSVVVHADKDDLGLGCSSLSKTTGNSGDRLACGVIGYASTQQEPPQEPSACPQGPPSSTQEPSCPSTQAPTQEPSCPSTQEPSCPSTQETPSPTEQPSCPSTQDPSCPSTQETPAPT